MPTMRTSLRPVPPSLPSFLADLTRALDELQVQGAALAPSRGDTAESVARLRAVVEQSLHSVELGAIHPELCQCAGCAR
jgi:hypothetical protein